MISYPLLKRTLQNNYKMILIFLAVLTMYFTIIAGMYDPDNLDIANMLVEMKLSEDMLKALGFTLTDTTLLGFLSSYFYGFLMIAFPMLFYIIMSNKVICGLVDKGSMTYLLSTPNKRNKIAFTQVVAIILGIFLLVSYVTILGLFFCEGKFPGILAKPEFIRLNVGAFLLHFAVSSISFLCSCIFSDSKHSVAFGAGIPIMFLLIQMLAQTSDQIENLKYATIFTLFSPINIIHGENYIMPFLALGLIGIILYTLGIVIFTKKDLCI